MRQQAAPGSLGRFLHVQTRRRYDPDMTADIIKLRQQRKRRARDERQQHAAENRIRFGRSGAEKERARREDDRAARSHDGHRMADDPGTRGAKVDED